MSRKILLFIDTGGKIIYTTFKQAFNRMSKFFFLLLTLAFLGGAFVPSADTALANKAGGAKTRLPNSLKNEKTPQDNKQTAEHFA